MSAKGIIMVVRMAIFMGVRVRHFVRYLLSRSLTVEKKKDLRVGGQRYYIVGGCLSMMAEAYVTAMFNSFAVVISPAQECRWPSPADDPWPGKCEEMIEKIAQFISQTRVV